MNNKFDELTKSLAQSVRRCGALKKFGAGLAGMALTCGVANFGAWAGPSFTTIGYSSGFASVHAVARISPLLWISPAQTNLFVLSLNNTNATVVLDGSLSSGGGNDPLTFDWLEDGAGLLATGVLATNELSVGSHTIDLVASDSTASSTNTVTFEVITPADAVGELFLLLDNVSGQNQNPLQATLNAAMAAFDRGNFLAGVNQLGAFQNKVRAQVAPDDPRTAETLMRGAQAIITTIVGFPPLVSVTHTNSTAVGNGADVELEEIDGFGLDNSLSGALDHFNAEYDGLFRNEVDALRFDLTGYSLADIRNAQLQLVNYRDDPTTAVLHFYAVKAGAVGLDNNTNAYYYTNGLSPHYTENNWDESAALAGTNATTPNATSLLRFSTMPGLKFDGNPATPGFNTNDVVDLGAIFAGPRAKGSLFIVSNATFVANLTMFLNAHPDPWVTILIGRDDHSSANARFASKEATFLAGGSPTGAPGDFAPRLVFDTVEQVSSKPFQGELEQGSPELLQIQMIGPDIILTWTNAAFQLQAAPAVSATFTNVPGATSPYTNAVSEPQRFFRLIVN
jgi:hypothetical protein